MISKMFLAASNAARHKHKFGLSSKSVGVHSRGGRRGVASAGDRNQCVSQGKNIALFFEIKLCFYSTSANFLSVHTF